MPGQDECTQDPLLACAPDSGSPDTEVAADPGIEGPIPEQEGNGILLETGVTPEFPLASRFASAAASNYRAWTGSSPRSIARIVIHITDGGTRTDGTVGWFQDPTAHVSAHYVIGQDGEIVQMVRHNDVAWHAHSANADGIGIEHVARSPNERGATDPGFFPTPAQYCSSAILVRWLCAQFGLPPDRTHIQGHTEADPATTHSDCPNGVWDWNFYMSLVTSG